MTAHDVWLGTLDLYIFFRRPLACFHPFQRLGRCHVQVSFVKILFLFFGNAFSPEVTWTVSFSVLHDGTVNPLRSCQSIFGFINITVCIHLSGTYTLGNGSCRSDGVFTSQCNEAHLESRHLCSGKKSHCISCACVKWRIPHFMSGKSWIVRSVKSCRTACRTKDCFCVNIIEDFFIHAESYGSGDLSVFRFIICDIYMIENGNVFLSGCCLCQDWFHILTVNLDISVSSGNIFAVFIFQDDQPQIFHYFCHMIQSL